MSVGLGFAGCGQRIAAMEYSGGSCRGWWAGGGMGLVDGAVKACEPLFPMSPEMLIQRIDRG